MPLANSLNNDHMENNANLAIVEVKHFVKDHKLRPGIQANFNGTMFACPLGRFLAAAGLAGSYRLRVIPDGWIMPGPTRSARLQSAGNSGRCRISDLSTLNLWL